MKILMHMCCAPCAIYPVESLKRKGHHVDGLYFNPNIHPYEEFIKREVNLEKLAQMASFEVFYMPDYKEDLWLSLKEGDVNKCRMCYELRMNTTFKFGKEKKYDAVTTSLLVSPYQKHDMIIDVCEKYSRLYQIPFYYEDFRLGYYEGQKKAKGFGLYCQRYCGCIVSLKEAIAEVNQKLKEKNNKEVVSNDVMQAES